MLFGQLQFAAFENANRYESAGAHGSVVVKALFYKPEGRGFDT
jgi:hypothetical protein